MSGLSKKQARRLIENALASLLDPRQDAESLSRYFAPDYVQDVDGKRLDFNGFIDHARTLKSSLRSGRATIETIIVDGMTIADIHVVDAEKTNGATIRAKVIAFYTVRDGKIVRVDASAPAQKKTGTWARGPRAGVLETCRYMNRDRCAIRRSSCRSISTRRQPDRDRRTGSSRRRG
jgi:ketosteroid isomerase-like protein